MARRPFASEAEATVESIEGLTSRGFDIRSRVAKLVRKGFFGQTTR